MSRTTVIKVNPDKPEEKAILKAAEVIRKGGLVIVPTETVYGIAANSQDPRAIERLCRIKNRPAEKHFSLHIADKDKIVEYAKDIPVSAFKLIDTFWPGPLTIVLRALDNSTVGIRMPDNEVLRRIIRQSNVPVVCPSANISGNPAPKDVAGALKDLEGQVDLAIDSGAAELGTESTVVDLTVEPPRILREGAVKEDGVLTVASKKNVLFVCTGNSCRSVMAEALLKQRLKELKRQDVEVSSAGIMKADGLGASYETAKLLRREGMDVSGHLSKRVTADLLNKSDLILVMEQVHADEIERIAPWVSNRVYLLKEFARVRDNSRNIPDPIGKSEEFYEMTLGVIRDAVNKISELI